MNTRSFSNQAEVGAWLIAAATDFGFNTPATPGGKKLGDAIVDNHVAMITARSLDEQRGAQGDWPKNQEPYATIKREEFGSNLVNVRTGEMLSAESLHGAPTITDKEVTHVYGTGRPGETPEPRPRGVGGVGKRKRQGPAKFRKTRPEPTDIQKAAWAAEQGRGFFELDDKIKAANVEIVGEALAEHLRSR
jgi:hypothetical protein